MIRRAQIVTDLGYGDSGKGSITDFLVRQSNASMVVRYNGGAQAAHNVVEPDGRHHTFSQWGSGTFAGAQTLLSKHVVVHPVGLLREAEQLIKIGVRYPFGSLLIDERCPMVLPYEQSMNRIRELARGPFRHGSCGIGIGEAVEDQSQEYGATISDIKSPDRLRRKMRLMQEAKLAVIEKLDLPEEADKEVNAIKDDLLTPRMLDLYWTLSDQLRIIGPGFLKRMLTSQESVVFEGAQGVLIDQKYGFHPYTTWSNCTDENALEMLGDFDGKVERVGVIRCYSTRHGPGPFVPYDFNLTHAIPDDHNNFHPWQREFRCGWFDVVATKYAMAANNGVDYLAVTCLDKLAMTHPWAICTKYIDPDGSRYTISPPADPTPAVMKEVGDRLFESKPEFTTAIQHLIQQRNLVGNIEAFTEKEVRITSRGPTHQDKRWEL